MAKSRRALSRPRVILNKIKRLYIDAYILRKGEDIFFIQIGSNDGRHKDPIYEKVKRRGWKGILVEPQEDVFEALKRNYEDEKDDLIFENSAISDKDGYITFYKSNKSGLSSIYPDDWFVNRNKNKAYTNRMNAGGAKEVKVRSQTFDSLLRKHHVTRIDLLQIDTEGYDFEIIKQIDFSRVKPRSIMYENKLLDESDKVACVNHLRDNGYRIIDLGNDTFAFAKKS